MMASHGSNPDVFLIPLQGVVLGPGAITPVLLSRPGCLLAVADHVDRGQPLVCVLQRGAEVVEVVQKSGWKTPGACLQSLVDARDLLGLKDYAAIEDRQRGQLL